MRELLGALLVAAALAISWFFLGRIRHRICPLHPMQREEHEGRTNSPGVDAPEPPPAADPIKSMEGAMREFRDGYARLPTLWTPRHIDPEVWSALHGRVPPMKRINKHPRHTLTRTDALKRNLKASR